MSVWMSLRGAYDIARQARSARELARAVVPRWRTVRVLNEAGDGEAPAAACDPIEAARTLRGLRNRIKGDALDARGDIDYQRLRRSAAGVELASAAAALRGVTPEALAGDDARTAFWINLYNVLAIHGVLALDIRASVMEVPSFFSTVAYRVGDRVYTLDDIENGVLRCNRGHPASGKRPFLDDDPRLAACPSRVDPRIHSALVCASRSCPPVGFYDPELLDDQLRLATEHYVAHGVTADDERRSLTLPMTFHYYREDFADLPGYLLEHADGDHRAAIERALAAGYKKRYSRYDWSLNSI